MVYLEPGVNFALKSIFIQSDAGLTQNTEQNLFRFLSKIFLESVTGFTQNFQ